MYGLPPDLPHQRGAQETRQPGKDVIVVGSSLGRSTDFSPVDSDPQKKLNPDLHRSTKMKI